MSLSRVASVLATIIALALLVAYFVKKQQERGQDPYYNKEVYFYEDSNAWGATAARFRADIASMAQVKIYTTAGGEDKGCGLVFENGKIVERAAPETCAALPSGAYASCGVWLYGPKPGRGTPGVAPFSAGVWFQQA
jgi:hypothetical protein